MVTKQALRILALPLYPGEFSSRIRMDFLVPFQRREGFRIDVFPPLSRTLFERTYAGTRKSRFRYHLSELFNRTRSLTAAGGYDIVWVQKGLALLPWRGLDLLRRLFSGRLVFDIDDAVVESSPIEIPRKADLFADPRQTLKLRRNADLVLCGNRQLLAEVAAEGRWVEWLPGTIPLNRYSGRPCPADDTPTLVWIGTASNRGYLNDLAPVLSRLSESVSGLRLLIVSDGQEGLNPTAFGNCSLELERWDPTREPDQIGRGWIGLMPLPEDRWTQRKGGYKILQYFACRLPVVASPVGINRTLVDEGVDGFLPRGKEDWIRALEVLLREPERRRRFGNAGRNKIEASYSTEGWVDKVVAWFRRLGPKSRP